MLDWPKKLTGGTPVENKAGLEEVLSECWNDIRQIAAEGSGFDPDWEKKTQV